MSIHRDTHILLLEEQLNKRFEKLLEELSGKKISGDEAKQRAGTSMYINEKCDYYMVHDTNLRLAIDDFATVLKEIKKLAK